MRQKMKQNRAARFFAGMLAVILLVNCCPMVFAAEGNVTIRTLKDLTDFADRCSSDAYSKDLKVVLAADIDAEGKAVSIPVFLGTFDGQGHKITGLVLDENNSGYGLFDRIESDAVVSNLTVEGEVTPSGTQSAVGGIAGENYGSIENCSFSGVVIGDSSIGGIAGKNNGTVTDCKVSGVVRGTTYTGGVAGQNSGTLLRCTNTAAVNTTVEESNITASDLQNLENAFYSLLKKEDATENAVTADTGGIAGYSTGVIQSCSNDGEIGYPHVGYNVGGIAGRQNGYLASSVNRGEVQGRKDVGGIVGQMEPDITLQFADGGIEELQKELNTLQNLINRTLDDAQATSDSVSGRVTAISGYADSARESASSLSDQTTDFVDANINTVNQTRLVVERYIDKFVPITDSLKTASGSVTDGISESRKLTEQISGTLVYNDEILSEMKNFTSKMEAACNDLLSGVDALEQAGSLIQDGPILPGADTTRLREDTQALIAALTQLSETIDAAREEYDSTGSVSAETQARLQADLEAVWNVYTTVVSDWVDVMIHIDFGSLREENEEQLRQILASIQTAMDAFYSAASHFADSMGDLCGAMETLRTINAAMKDILDSLDTTLQAAEQGAKAMARAMSDGAQWVRDLSGEDTQNFSPLGAGFDESSSGLNASLSGISSELSALNDEITSSNTTLLSDVRAVNNQFMKVMNLFLNALNDTQNMDYTDVFEDVSEESLESATRGKVLECTNYGTVLSDRNAGGIAGSMAIEYDFDPEDDLFSSDNRSAHFTYQTKAILMDCNNYGSVQVKKDCAGGMTGRMDLGTISGCGGFGSVESESGDYAGGVAGLSLSSIRNSYAKCMLSGGKYVGGIAGSGNRITDCISMVEITDSTQLAGAIAGEITGEYTGNYFVSDTLAGVDRVSYSGKAEQMDYAGLLELDNIPEDFRHLTLRFVADDTELLKQTFDYGASFTDEIYPQAPEKEDCYVQWDKSDLKNLHFDTIVTAEYEPYVTTLASDSESEGKARVLVEGNFHDGDSLEAERIDDLSGTPENTIEAWQLTIPEDGEENHEIRWLIPSDHAGSYEIYTGQGNSWEKADSEAVGSYLCFELAEGSRFAVIYKEKIVWWIWGISAAAVVVVAAGGVLICRKVRKE